MAADLAFTLAEAATILDPPMTPEQLRAIVTALGWQPCGKRHTGRGGRPADTWDAGRLMRLHAAVTPFLDAARLPACLTAGEVFRDYGPETSCPDRGWGPSRAGTGGRHVGHSKHR